MVQTVDISNIFSVRSFLNSSYQREKIKEYFQKKTYSSETKNFRPESEPWLKSKEKDDEIASIPDHNVKINYDTLVIKHRYNEVKFNIGTITFEEIYFNEFEEDDNFRDITLTFLVENSYWGHGLICSFDELMSDYRILQLLEESLDSQRQDKWIDSLKNFGDGVFMLLLDKIVKLEKNLINTKFYESYTDGLYVEIGEQKYYAKDMIKINEVYKTGEYSFYDENDRKIEYKEYYYESFPDFYMKYSSEK